MKITLTQFKLIILFLCISNYVNAQYLLKIDDVKFDKSTGTLNVYYGTEPTEIIIPDQFEGVDVKKIGANAFEANQLIRVVIPNTVEEIGKNAFSFNQLTSLTLGNSVTIIRENAFSGNELTELVIPNSVKEIKTKAFEKNKLVNLTLGNSVVKIGEKAFWDNKLISLIIPDSVTEIEESAFNNNKLESISIGRSVSMIGNSVFAGNKLTEINIPNTVTSIDDFAFSYNEIKEISIPNTIVRIGDYAFFRNKIESLIIPESVKDLGEAAFNQNKITSLKIPNTITEIKASTFSENLLTELNIPNTIVFIGEYAFSDNQLSSITIPNSVTKLDENAFKNNTSTKLNIEKKIGYTPKWTDSKKNISYGTSVSYNNLSYSILMVKNTLSFEMRCNNTIISESEFNINGTTYFTDSKGKIIIENIELGEYEYIINSELYTTEINKINLEYPNTTREIEFKKKQIITFNNSTKAFVGDEVVLDATASSGLNLIISLISGDASIEDNKIRFNSTGEVKIKLAQGGNSEFKEVEKIITFNVAEVKIENINIISDNIKLIDKDKGTLLLKAEVLPSNSTNKTVTWSIISGIENATIDQTGLLKAINNGIVTVKALSNDGSEISAEITINISHQNNNAPEVVNSTINITENSNEFDLSSIVSDKDLNTKFINWAISDNKYYNINEFGKLIIKENIILDYESETNFSFNLSVSDGKYTLEKDISVNIIDVDDVAPSINNLVTEFSVDLGMTNGEIIHTFEINDIDTKISENSHEWTLVSDNEVFKLVDGKLILNKVEDIQDKDNEIELTFNVSDGTNLSENYTISIQINRPTRTNIIKDISIKLFPNPTQSYWNLYCTKLKSNIVYYIHNVVGRQIDKGIIENGKLNYRKKLEKGIYFVTLIINGKRISKKLIIN